MIQISIIFVGLASIKYDVGALYESTVCYGIMFRIVWEKKNGAVFAAIMIWQRKTENVLMFSPIYN